MAICGRPSKAMARQPPPHPRPVDVGVTARPGVPLGAAQRRALGASFSIVAPVYEGCDGASTAWWRWSTGRASRIRAATAELLAERGARVAVLDLDPDAADARHLRLACDVGDRASVEAAVGRVAADLGGLDVVVNNAGIGAQGDVAANDDDEWRRVLDVNVVGIVRVSRAALPHLRRSERAAVVNTCSVVATLGLPNRARMRGQQGRGAGPHPGHGRRPRPRGHPGQLRHPRHGGDALGRPPAGGGRRPGGRAGRPRARQPLGRLVGPAEVAAAIAYLASPQAGATAGTALAVDGGMAGLRLPGQLTRGWRCRSRGRRSGCARCRPRPRSGRRPGPGSGGEGGHEPGPGGLGVGGGLVGVGVLVQQLGVGGDDLGASSSKWTTIWAPRASTRPTVALRRVSARASRTRRASSMSSLRIPTATSGHIAVQGRALG